MMIFLIALLGLSSCTLQDRAIAKTVIGNLIDVVCETQDSIDSCLNKVQSARARAAAAAEASAAARASETLESTIDAGPGPDAGPDAKAP